MQPGEVFGGEVKTARSSPGAPAMPNDPLARPAGFRGGLILNEYHFTQISEMLLQHFGLRWLKHGEIEIRYISPLFDGDTFVPKAEALGEDPPGSGRIALKIWCENQDGEHLAAGKASCLLGGEPAQHG